MSDRSSRRQICAAIRSEPDGERRDASLLRQHSVFASSYGTGGGLLNLTVQNGAVGATEACFTGDTKNHHGGMVLVYDIKVAVR